MVYTEYLKELSGPVPGSFECLQANDLMDFVRVSRG